MTAAWKTNRRRTAIPRKNLSIPARLLLESSIARSRDTYLDYGCGRGDDVAQLRRLGIQAHGWDPAFFPTNPKKPASVVCCAYVLNVIEDPNERSETLRDAWNLADRMLCVALRIEPVPTKAKPYADGIITAHNTFQKFFTHVEASDFIAAHLKVVPKPLAPGVFVIPKQYNFETLRT